MQQRNADQINQTEQLEDRKLSELFLGLCLKCNKVLREWIRDRYPTIDQFPKGHQRLAKAVWDTWKTNKVRLSRQTYLAMISADQTNRLIPKQSAAEETLYNRVLCIPPKWKAADGPMLRQQIAKLPHTPAGQKQIVKDVVKQAHKLVGEIGKGAAAWWERRDPKEIADLAAKFKELQQIAAPPRTLNIRSTDQKTRKIEPPTIIEDLLRKGEVANLVASPKMRKSWAVADLAFCYANGLQWLKRFPCYPCRVYLIDNELREWQMQKRFDKMAAIYGSTKPFGYTSLRDDGPMNIDALEMALTEMAGLYDLIILDALYRFYPADFDENSNSDMTALYNRLDAIATSIDAASQLPSEI